MEDKDSVKKIYKQYIKEFKRHNKLYYSKDKPSITDKEYDELKKNILELEEKLKLIDKGITIWCEPVGDKSKLRKLRGVEIVT